MGTRLVRRSRSRAIGPDLTDGRSGRVVFVSHCLLNQNTRYLGGAVCPGAVSEAVDGYLDAGVGVVQMPCPEQREWGGVLKRRLLWVLDHPRTARAARVGSPVVLAYLRRRYRRLARQVVAEIDDYQRSGLTVVAVVGVGGSPSCGVGTTVDLDAAIAAVAERRGSPVTVRWLNEEVVGPATTSGQGLFMEALTQELARRDLDVEVREHALTSAPAEG